MTQRDGEIARRNHELLNEAYRKRDFDEFAKDAFDPEIVLTGGPNFPEQGEWRGIEQAKRFIADQAEAFSDVSVAADEIIDAGHCIVVAARFGGTARQSGTPIEFTVFHVWTSRDDKVLRGDMYATREEAMQGAGLPVGEG